MNLTIWIDVAIGLSVIFLGTSLFVTIINEYVAQALDLRGRRCGRHLSG
jgi:3D (Asp-Asp-Asp) domain-containing protein